MSVKKSIHMGTDEQPRAAAGSPARRIGPESRGTSSPARCRIGGDGADQELVLAALELRRDLAETYGNETVTKQILADGAAAAHYLQQKVTDWTATLANVVERDLFGNGADGLTAAHLTFVGVGGPLDRLARQLELQERATKQTARFIAALREEARASFDDERTTDGRSRGGHTRTRKS